MDLNQSELLTKILADVENSENPVTVFDLDSTLFHVNPRTLKILHDFAADPLHQERYPEAVKIIAQAEKLTDTYKVRDQMVHLGLTDQAHEFYFELYQFWRSHFFSNAFLHLDEPYAGAVEYTQELSKRGAHLIYLTGRDVHRMGEGTKQALIDSGFPMQDSELVLKPHYKMDDAEYKRDYFLEIDTTSRSVWFFENEPQNIHYVREHVPEVSCIYFDSVNSGSAPPPEEDHVPRIRSFIY